MASRRAFLAVAILIGTAGCTGDDDRSTPVPSPTASPTEIFSPTPSPTPTPARYSASDFPATLVDGSVTTDLSWVVILEDRAWLVVHVDELEPLDEGLFILAPTTERGSNRLLEGDATYRELPPGEHDIGIELDDGYVDRATVRLVLYDWREVNPVSRVVDDDWGRFVDAWSLPTTVHDGVVGEPHYISVRTDDRATVTVDAGAPLGVGVYRQHPDPRPVVRDTVVEPDEPLSATIDPGIHAIWVDPDDDEITATIRLDPIQE